MPGPGDRLYSDANLDALMASLKNMGAGNVIWHDLGLNQFIKNMKVLDKTWVQVGIVGAQAEAPSGDGRLTLGEVAHINEFGSRAANIPARHFVQGTVTPFKANAEARQIMNGVMNFEDPTEALHEAGRRFAEEIRDRIYRGDFAANAAATVLRKGFDHPLMDTSRLADAVTHELVPDGEGDAEEWR